MAKINPNFPHDVYRFLHRPIRDIDKKDGRLFVERFLVGTQTIFEDTQDKIDELNTLRDPALIRADLLQFLKDQVGFTSELNNITNDLGENDLRKLISLAVALWKKKGIEPGYSDIIRLFTGKSSRIFNWFDFRMIVGEVAFGEEQLGEDSWLISVPGVEASGIFDDDEPNDIISLITFEQNVKDRSITRNDASIIGAASFFSTPASTFPQGSDFYIRLNGGVVKQPHSNKYDLSGDFSVELFFRAQVSETNKMMVQKWDGSKGFKIEIDKSTNTILYTVSDGSVTVSDSITPAADLDDGINRHIALVVDRTKDGARLWVNGTEATAKSALGALADCSNIADIFIGGSSQLLADVVKADFDNFRLAKDNVYDVDTATLPPPLTGFIEFQEELLHEFETDIRIVDERDGTLNKTLILRILNLMRPASERLNVIFIRFFDDFFDGLGRFETLQGSTSVNTTQQLVLVPDTIVQTSVFDDTEFQDIVLQVKANGILDAGSIFSVLFFIQDIDNFYEFRINTITRVTSLHKTIAGFSSVISAAVTEDIVPKASYIYTVHTDLDQFGDTLIRAFVDSNLQHEVVDSSFVKGKFGMQTDATSTMQVDEIEMMQIPTDIQFVKPGFDL